MVRRKWWLLAAVLFLGGAILLVAAVSTGKEAEQPGGTLVKAEQEVTVHG